MTGFVTESRVATKARVLVADDEESMRYFVSKTLSRNGYETTAVEDGGGAIAQFEAQPVDVAVLDLKMPGVDGLTALSTLKRLDPDLIVIVMTAFGTVSTAVQSMKCGAEDYITKPFDADELLLVIEKALAHRATVRENRDLRRLIDNRMAYAGLVGQSPAMRSVFQAIDLVADSDATVLISGESGTGKELVARAIHARSTPRRTGPFVAVNCAALKESLVDSELFGYVPGAFTGAKKHKQGMIARAARGTLFLDEISETSLQTQSKVARFLQEGEILPLGTTQPVPVDARVVTATNRILSEVVNAGAFRSDLYFRLNVVPIDLPPLRERRDDVPALAKHFLARFAMPGDVTKTLSVNAMSALTTYSWPGNIRELENTIERLVVMNAGVETLTFAHLPEEIIEREAEISSEVASGRAVSYQDAIARADYSYFKDLFRRTKGNVSESARIAGLSRGHFHRKAGHLGLDPASFRAD